MGRPPYEIWALFDVDIPRSKEKIHPDATCRQCNSLVTNAQPSRNMLKHVLECRSISEEERAKWRLLGAQQRRAKQLKLTMLSARKLNQRRGTPSSVNKQLFVTPSSNQKRRNTLQTPKKSTKEDRFLTVTTGFYATDIPFRVVDDPYFKAMFDYEFPSRDQLAKTLLDKIYQREKARVLECISTVTNLSLITDGWSNPNNKSIINFMIANPYIRPVFWKSIATGEAAHSSEYIAEQISIVIDDVEKIVGKGVVCSVVTDNASIMIGAWRILERERRGLICNGCASHTMNLLLKNVFGLEYFASVLKKATLLAKFIKNRDALLDRFRAMQKQLKGQDDSRRALSIPVPTRWYSCESCIRSVVENKDAIAATFSDNNLLNRYKGSIQKLRDAKAVLLDEAFWNRADIVLKIVRPITDCLALFEKDNCCISMIFHQFIWLKSHHVYTQPVKNLDTAIQNMILDMIEDRRRFLFTRSMGIAYFLDQTKTLSGFVDNGIIDTIANAVSMAQNVGHSENVSVNDFHNDLVAFARSKNRWSPEEKEKHSKFNPLDWWSLSNMFPNLQGFALRIFCIPTPSASSERSWNIHSFIHSKRCNRLTADRIEKLIFVYSNIENKGPVDHILYDLFPDACDHSNEYNLSGDGDEDTETMITM